MSLNDHETEFSSLDAAFVSHHTPFENQIFIRELLFGVDVKRLLDRGVYIKVERESTGPAIQIHFGYSNGFRSEEEILGVVGDVERWESGRGLGLWGVTHPQNKIREGSGGVKAERQQWGHCSTCGLALPASGTCGWCD